MKINDILILESLMAFAEEVKNQLGLKQFSLHERGNDIYLNSIIVGREQQGQGLGSKALSMLIDYADSEGKRIILTPAIQDKMHGTTSRSRLVRFYKKFGFVESKGRNIDYEVGAGKMYREPK